MNKINNQKKKKIWISILEEDELKTKLKKETYTKILQNFNLNKK